jgi:hypothetical protein
MARSRKWNGASAKIKAPQNLSEDGLEDLPPPSRLPAEPKISGTRVEAIERGRILGVDEVSRRRETDGESRLARAMAYAAWEFDGKPSGVDYKKEFGIKGDIVTGSFDRPEK